MSHNPSSKGHSRRRKSSFVTSPTVTEQKSWHNRRTSSTEIEHMCSKQSLDETPYFSRSAQLDTVPGTPRTPHCHTSNQSDMSLDHSPTFRTNGGWSSPGLNADGHGRASMPSSPRRIPLLDNHNEATWTSTQGKGGEIKGFSPIPQSSRFLPRKMFRQLSISLPRFNRGSSKDYSAKEKLGRGRIPQTPRERLTCLGLILWRVVWRLRAAITLLLAISLVMALFYKTRRLHSLIVRVRTILIYEQRHIEYGDAHHGSAAATNSSS